MAYFDDHKNSTGALCTRLSTDAAAVHGATGARVGSTIMNLASLTTGIIIAFVYSWKLALCVLAFMPMIAIAGVLQMKILQGTANSGKSALEQAGKVSGYVRVHLNVAHKRVDFMYVHTHAPDRQECIDMYVKVHVLALAN